MNTKNKQSANKPNSITGYFGSLFSEPRFRFFNKPKQVRGKTEVIGRVEWVADVLFNGQPTGNVVKAAIWESEAEVTDDAGNPCIALYFDAGWISAKAWGSESDDAKDYKTASLDYLGRQFEEWQDSDQSKLAPRLVTKAGRVTKYKPIAKG